MRTCRVLWNTSSCKPLAARDVRHDSILMFPECSAAIIHTRIARRCDSRYIQRSLVPSGMGVDNREVTVFLGNMVTPRLVIERSQVTPRLQPSVWLYRSKLYKYYRHFTGPICLPLTKVNAASGPTQWSRDLPSQEIRTPRASSAPKPGIETRMIINIVDARLPKAADRESRPGGK